MKLRPYQQDAVDSIWGYFRQRDGNPLLALPTGTGKSVIIGDFLRQAFEVWPEQRVLILTHVKELLEQNLDKLLTLWPTAPAGLYSAGLKRRDTIQPIIFAGIASIAKRPEAFGKIDLVLVDECHLISHREETMYAKFLDAIQSSNPLVKVIGFTATPYRMGLGHLLEGGLFTDICFDLTGLDSFNKLVADGWLAPLITKRTQQMLDTSGVRLSGGEFVQRELQRAVDRAEVTDQAVQELLHYGQDRKHWLIFTSGVEHAEHTASCLNYYGISAKALHSEIGAEERSSILRDFKSGKIQAVTNNNILTTGFDFPGIDLIGVLRPTRSAVLWVQMLGRGTRPSPEKENCLVLDFAGNTRVLGPINDPILPKRKGEKCGGQAPVRVCEVCSTYNAAAARFCCCCGAEFPREHRLATTAYTEEVMASGEPITADFAVDHVSYTIHNKAGKPPSLKVSYYCGLRLFSEWVCLEHSGYAKKKAHEWWRARSTEDAPETVAAASAIANTLKVPSSITVWVNAKHPEITSYAFL